MMRPGGFFCLLLCLLLCVLLCVSLLCVVAAVPCGLLGDALVSLLHLVVTFKVAYVVALSWHLHCMNRCLS